MLPFPASTSTTTTKRTKGSVTIWAALNFLRLLSLVALSLVIASQMIAMIS
jgi:hypothetical protein